LELDCQETRLPEGDRFRRIVRDIIDAAQRG